MAVTVKLPTQLRDAAGGSASAEVEGGTVGEALEALYAQHGELRARHAENARITDQPVATNPTHCFTIALEPSPWAAVRALQALLTLGEHGTVVCSIDAGEYGADYSKPTDARATYYADVSAAFASIGVQSCAWGYTNTFNLWDDKIGWVDHIADGIVTTTTLPPL